DWWGVTDRQPNATVMHSINADAFYDLLYDSLARL
ncbi:MAG: nucleoside hydrolase, partial [SAR324 cluster bacterium]|nr:nucleoside hydrolase [SAR324 cluster bacterium]